VLRDLIAAEPCVLATGGGVVLRETNRRLLQGAGLVVWLTADADTLAARMQRDPNTADRRPALAGGGMKEIEDILTQRDPLYREVANLVVSTVDRSPDEIAATIVTAWTS
jgi:shikimate kinase